MNRLFSAICVLSMMLLAVLICVRQTIAAGDGLGDAARVLLAAEAFAVVGILAILGLLLRKMMPLSRRPTEQRFEAFRSLRRLLSTVWS